MNSKNICMYGSSSNALDEAYYQAARNLGRIFAKAGYGLVFGGGQAGLMGAASQGAKSVGGRVVGVIPEALNAAGLASEICDELIVTQTMRERKAVMEERSVGFVALPGGYGTLEELLEIITLKQLEYHNKPIVIFNTNGFYDLLIEMFLNLERQRFAHPETREVFFVSDDADEVLRYIETYKPGSVARKWVTVAEESFEP